MNMAEKTTSRWAAV